MSKSKAMLPGVMCAFLLMAGCDLSLDSSLDQEKLCEVKSADLDTTTGSCVEGQKIVFAPNSWGNQQLPVLFAAVNCDHRYAIAMSTGAVSCIFRPIKEIK